MPQQYEPIIRLSCFLGVLAVMSLWQWLAPRRAWTAAIGPRVGSNLALVVLNAVSLRWLVPISSVVAAEVCQSRGWGVLHLVQAPDWVEVLLAVLAFDLAIYLQHVLFHAVPALWRLHKVHHVDPDFDVTTGLRFHTLEIWLSALIKLAAVVVIGPTPFAVIIFEVLLNATAMFNHSNARLPVWLDAGLRWLIVTPDMHRVHHSVHADETNSNFGFNIPWWDRLLGTYRAQPRDGHTDMTIGLDHPRDEQTVARLPGMLWLPFRNDSSSAKQK